MNEFENFDENAQNNNGPISATDLENIQNNNAVDYIQNQNEIGADLVQPPLYSINRNLIEVVAQISPQSSNFSQLNVQSESSEYENVNQRLASISSLNHPSTVEIVNNDKIEILHDTIDNESNNFNHLQQHVIVTTHTKQHKLDNSTSTDDDEPIDFINSVEAALRELDFAISGEDSFLNDDCDSDDAIYDKTVDDEQNKHHQQQQRQNEIKIDIDNESSDLDKFQINEIGEPSTFYRLQTINNDENHINDEQKVCTINSPESVQISNDKLVNAVANENKPNELLDASQCDDNNLLENLIDKNDSIDSKETTYDGHNKNNIESIQMNVNVINNTLNEYDILNDSIEKTFGAAKFDASTPCIQTKTMFPIHEIKSSAKLLFPFVNDETINQSNECKTIDITNEVPNVTFDVICSPNEMPSITDELPKIIKNSPSIRKHSRDNPTIRIDRDDVTSHNLTTITPMNTPIELNYVTDSWDNFVSKSMNKILPMNSCQKENCIDKKSINETITIAPDNDSWYLHPLRKDNENDDTFDVNKTRTLYDGADDNDDDDDNNSNNDDYNDDDDDDIIQENYDDDDEDYDDEENRKLLNFKFNELRKQLEIALPHASGNVSATLDFSGNVNDEDAGCESDSSLELLNEEQTEVVINYKRQLSPIVEESEDETCKTFVMNETKCFDSTR